MIFNEDLKDFTEPASFSISFCFCVTGAAILMNIARDLLAWKYTRNSIYVKLIPIPAVIGIPSFIGAYFTLDMGIGAIILAIWQAFNPADAKASAPVVASALIAGDGVWTIPAAILALAKVSPPMCAQVCLPPRSTVHSRCASLLLLWCGLYKPHVITSGSSPAMLVFLSCMW